MDKTKYAKLVKSKSKNPNIFEDAIISFLVGGILGSLALVLIMFYEKFFSLSEVLSTCLMSMTFILGAVILTGLGIFDKLVSKYKFGLIIPITGFAHSVASALLDYKRDGLITGLGSNMFKLAGSVILYGTVSAFICTILKVIIYG